MQGLAGNTDVARSVQLAVAPVFLLSDVGVFITVFTNRLARIIDRARSLETIPPTAPDETRTKVDIELQVLSRRSQLVHRAITLSSFCALLICLARSAKIVEHQ